MERPGVYLVEVATVVNMRTVTGDGQVVLGYSRGTRLVRIYILLDMTAWLIMERDSVWRRGMALGTRSQSRGRYEREETNWYLIFMKKAPKGHRLNSTWPLDRP